MSVGPTTTALASALQVEKKKHKFIHQRRVYLDVSQTYVCCWRRKREREKVREDEKVPHEFSHLVCHYLFFVLFGFSVV